MKQQKNRLTFFMISLFVMMSLCFLPQTPSHASEDGSGKCGQNLTWTYTADTQTVTISGTGKMYNYDEDANWAPWSAYDYTTVVIEEGVTSIGSWAFAFHEELIEISIPSTVTRIEDVAFEWCNNLTSITFPNNLTSIGSWAFAYSGLTEVSIPNKVTRIGHYAFDLCESLESVTIGSGLISLGDGAFAECNSLTAFSVNPANTAYCTEDGIIFDKNKHTLMQYPAGKTGDYSIPDTVYTINTSAFQNCLNLTAITIPNSVETIGYLAFDSCGALTSLEIPNSVDDIDSYAFVDCRALREIYFNGNLPDMGSYQFERTTLTAYYPENNSTWTAEALISYGGTVTWETWEANDPAPALISIYSGSCVLSSNSYTYDGTEKKPIVTFSYGQKVLRKDKDYTLAYSNNINASIGSKLAVVTIKGKGKYTGTYTRYFTINKADQSLLVSCSSYNISVGKTAAITAAGKGALTYSSSDTSIARVSSSGVITGISAGTAKITVKAAETDNYNEASKEVVITVTGSSGGSAATLQSLTYSFENSASDLGYAAGYKIPLSRYQMFFSNAQAKIYYDLANTWKGSCFGFASTAGMFNVPGSDLNVSGFKSSAKAVSDLSTSNRNTSLGLSVLELLEAMQISQKHNKVAIARTYNTDLNEICREVKKVENGGAPVIISIGNEKGEGHALVGYKVTKVNNSTTRLYVYDCNYSNMKRYITLSANSSGNYTGWSYVIGAGETWSSSKGGQSRIAYIPYSAYQAAWEERNTNQPSSLNMMFINSDNFIIKDLNGNVVAAMNNGILDSKDREIFDVLTDEINGEACESNLIYMPAEAYQIINNDTNIPELDISVVNIDQSTNVVTDADTVEIFINDSQEASLVSVDANQGETYEITIDSSQECMGTQEQVAYMGNGKEETATVGVSEGAIVTAGYSGTGMVVNGDEVNLPQKDNQLSSCDVAIEYTSCTYDGTPKKPAVVVSNDSRELVNGKDYTVVYKNNLRAGTAEAVIYGIGDYEGVFTETFTINKTSLSGYSASLSESQYIYDGTAKVPEVILKNGEEPLQYGVDYTVTYKNNTAVGTATVVIQGIGNYNGQITRIFTITNPAGAGSTTNPAVTRLSSPVLQTISNTAKGVKITWKPVANATGYSIYRKVGDAKTWKKLRDVDSGVSYYTDTTGKSNGKKYSYTVQAFYNGSGGTIRSSYNTAGKTYYYIIAPTLKSAKNQSPKKIYVKWKKTKNASGYQIQYSLEKNFKGAKTIKISGEKKISGTITKLKKGKKYYVRLRSCRTISKKKYYSAWSGVKKVKIKK